MLNKRLHPAIWSVDNLLSEPEVKQYRLDVYKVKILTVLIQYSSSVLSSNVAKMAKADGVLHHSSWLEL